MLLGIFLSTKSHEILKFAIDLWKEGRERNGRDEGSEGGGEVGKGVKGGMRGVREEGKWVRG